MPVFYWWPPFSLQRLSTYTTRPPYKCNVAKLRIEWKLVEISFLVFFLAARAIEKMKLNVISGRSSKRAYKLIIIFSIHFLTFYVLYREIRLGHIKGMTAAEAEYVVWKTPSRTIHKLIHLFGLTSTCSSKKVTQVLDM